MTKQSFETKITMPVTIDRREQARRWKLIARLEGRKLDFDNIPDESSTDTYVSQSNK